MNDTDKLIFPSGLTVRRAKQRAKAAAKMLNIKHSEALHVIARENSDFNTWNDAIEDLKRNAIPTDL